MRNESIKRFVWFTCLVICALPVWALWLALRGIAHFGESLGFWMDRRDPPFPGWGFFFKD